MRFTREEYKSCFATSVLRYHNAYLRDRHPELTYLNHDLNGCSAQSHSVSSQTPRGEGGTHRQDVPSVQEPERVYSFKALSGSFPTGTNPVDNISLIVRPVEIPIAGSAQHVVVSLQGGRIAGRIKQGGGLD